VHDWRLKRPGERNHLIVRSPAARAGQDRHPLGGIEHLGGSDERLVGRADHRRGRPDHRCAGVARGVVQEDLAGDDHDGDSAAFDRVAHRDFQHPGQLLRHADQLGVDTAGAKQLLRMGFLKVASADLLTRDVRGDRQQRNPAAVRIEQTIDEMQVPGTAARRAHGELARHRRLTRGRERRRLLMTHVLPDNLTVAAKGVGEPIDRIPRQPIDPAHAGRRTPP
jgi:hypothetical protein